MHSLLVFLSFLGQLSCFTSAVPLPSQLSVDLQARSVKGVNIPFRRSRGAQRLKRGDLSGEIGLGDNSDLLYTVPIQLGDTLTAVHLDTGSSDLWVVSNQCKTGTCVGASASAARYDTSVFNATGSSVTIQYGDSTTGTNAAGPIGFDTATIAGIAIRGQTFAAVNSTTNTVVSYGAAGIFGLGFPSGSDIQEAIVTDRTGPLNPTDDFVSDTYTYGPLLSRISMTNALEEDLFAISLQRDTIDIGAEDGVLTLGKLPDGVDNSSLTWVPVRLYAPEDGGLSPPTFAPDEVYPFRWEVDIDAVYLDGKKVADSSIPATGGVSSTLSALIDTGNSIIRGPSDVVNNILSTVSPKYTPSNSASATLPCTAAHTLAFQIGGKMFPIDPRDFIGDTATGDATTCVADNIVATDPPGQGATFRWSLGDPFIKSTLVAFHYGNLTHPSVDPPRMGFLTKVPLNADSLLTQAVNDAQSNGGNFESTIQLAPTASAAAEASTAVTVVPNSQSFSTSATPSTPSTTVTVSMGGGATPTSNGNSSSQGNAASRALGGGHTHTCWALAMVVAFVLTNLF